MSAKEIKQAVRNLSEKELEEFFEWLDEFHESQWDRQIEEDFRSGKLNYLVNQARKEFREGRCQEL